MAVLGFSPVGRTRASAPYEVFLPVVYSSAPQVPIPPTPTATSLPPTLTPTPTRTPSSPSPTPTPTNTPAPNGPQIAHTSLYVDFINYTHVLGEVINYSGASIYYASATVTFCNANGTVAGTYTTYVLTTMIQPGERSPFDAILQPQPGSSTYNLTLAYNTTTYAAYSHAFAFSGQSQWSDSFETHYTGTVTNDSGQALEFPKVVLTGYDPSGDVVIADYTYVNGLSNNTMSNGQSGPYELSELNNRASLVAQTAFLAEG